MITKNDGGAAFPRPTSYVQSTEDITQEGMLLRDYFAAKICAADTVNTGLEGSDVHLRAAMSYEQADALIEARKKGE
jgi:hypothetical protein